MHLLVDNELSVTMRYEARQDKDTVLCFFGQHIKLEQSLRLKVPKALEQQDTLSWKTPEWGIEERT